MQLLETTRENILDVFMEYSKHNLVADKAFYEIILELIKKDNRFYWGFKYVLDEKRNSLNTAYFIDRELCFNLPNIEIATRKSANIWTKRMESLNLLEVQNLYTLFAIFHESSHFFQKAGLEEEAEINRFYQELYTFLDNINICEYLHYRFFAPNYCFERHANIDSFKELAIIFKDNPIKEIAQSNHLYNLNYKFLKYSPVEYTFKHIHQSFNYMIDDISVSKKIDVGFPLENTHLCNLDEALYAYSNGINEYNEAVKKILKIGCE